MSNETKRPSTVAQVLDEAIEYRTAEPRHPTYDPTLQVIIPLPTNIPRARGIHATNRFADALQVRMSAADRKLIGEEAARLGMTPSMFTRWCAVYAAEALRRHRDGEQTHVDP